MLKIALFKILVVMCPFSILKWCEYVQRPHEYSSHHSARHGKITDIPKK